MLSSLPTASADRQRSRSSFRYLDLAFFLLVVVRCAWIFSALFRSPGLPLRLAQDDFYYYLKTAQNLAWHHRSTFFDGVLTNGYHPLYFLLLAVVSCFVHTVPGIFRFLWVLDTVSAVTIFWLTRRLFAEVCSPLLANGLAVLLTAFCLTQICDQMEVTLTLPLGFAFLLAGFVPGSSVTPRRAAVIGTLAALTFLSRLDAGLLALLYVLGSLCTREYRQALTTGIVASFVATALPVPVFYVWINHHYFHTLLPISGMAKELRNGWAPSLLPPESFSGTNEILVNLTLAAAILAWALRRHLLPREKVLLFAVLLTPFVFYSIEMLISDWQLWDWYFYVLRFSAAGVALVLAILLSRPVLPAGYPHLKALLGSPVLAATLCVVATLRLATMKYKVDGVMIDIQHAGEVLDTFALKHPGTYAMGDRAGMFAMLTPEPVLQAEGLLMDPKYLEHIRRQDDLRSVLSSYGVKYYVAFVMNGEQYQHTQNRCFYAMEPAIAGPSALRMRSTFCEAPLARFAGSEGEYLIFRVNPL